MASRKKTTTEDISVVQISRETVTVVLRGTSPLIMNRLSEKAKRELLLPSGRKTAGDKRTTLKHNPLEEFRAAPHRLADAKAPTLLAMPATAFKAAMRGVAVDVPNASSKAQLGRLTYVEGEYVPIYGIPQIKMDAVRLKDAARTPDIRSRCIVADWVAILTVVYATPILNGDAIITLLANAGLVQGVGDWRPEKGSGNYGTWTMSDLQDSDVKRIIKGGGREAQLSAMADPKFYDDESEELYLWFDEEASRRGLLRRA